MTRTLVTGGSGFIGSALVRALVDRGEGVRVLDDGSRGVTGRLVGLEGRVEIVAGDIRDAPTVARAVRECDRVIHLAYVNGTRFFYTRPELVLEVAVKGIVNVLDACRAYGVRELFLASSSEVYQDPPRIPTGEDVPLVVPDPLNPRYSYGGGKIIAELMAINYGRTGFDRVVIFRPHNVYGPDMGWDHVIPELTLRVRDLARGSTGRLRLAVQGTGEETRSFTFIDDLVAGVLILLDRGAHLGIYHVGSGTEHTIAELARAIGRCFEREIELEPAATPAGAPRRRCPDTSRIRALGFRPRVPLDEGLPPTVHWYDAHADERPR